MSRFDDYKHAMDMVKEVEQGPVSKFSAETRCFADLIRSVDFYHMETRKTLLAEIAAWKDASGLERGGDPDSVTPAKAKEFWDSEARIIPELEEEIRDLRDRLNKFCSDHAAMATEFRVPVPEPGTDASKLLLSAKSSRDRASRLETENLKLLAEIEKWRNLCISHELVLESMSKG